MLDYDVFISQITENFNSQEELKLILIYVQFWIVIMTTAEVGSACLQGYEAEYS